jgi:phosphohistidine phosphatase
MMRIYIVRHAIAEDSAKGGGGDAQRALTSEGRKKMKEVAAGFMRLEPQIDRIFSSPLIRAKQTAEIMATPLKKKVEQMVELSPGHAPSDVLRRLRELKEDNNVMLVGHEPNCSQLASYLLSETAQVDIQFKKGGICLIESQRFGGGDGFLLWVLTPQVLRLMNASSET